MTKKRRIIQRSYERRNGSFLQSLLATGPEALWLPSKGVTLVDPTFIDPSAFNSSAWLKLNVSVGVNVTTDPDGGSAADSIIADTTPGASHVVYQAPYVYIPDASTVSVYVKADTISWFYIRDTSTGGGYAFFNVSTGALGTTSNCTSTITDVGSGWYLCTATFPAKAATQSSIFLGITTGDGLLAATFTGGEQLFVYNATWTNPTTQGDWISAIADQTGNGHHLTQTTASLQCFYNPTDSDFNNKPSFEPPATTDTFLVPSTLDSGVATPAAFLAVHKASASGGVRYLADLTGAGGLRQIFAPRGVGNITTAYNATDGWRTGPAQSGVAQSDLFVVSAANGCRIWVNGTPWGSPSSWTEGRIKGGSPSSLPYALDQGVALAGIWFKEPSASEIDLINALCASEFAL